ncbi:MAG: 4-hydroxythreonine-4-phosphate dehydrogenase PdxA [Bacteroidales bacterium]|nr:4-hydroxythreonine-4-phosphate dehydrogenase PdxA [Bacteroidales bacterium]
MDNNTNNNTEKPIFEFAEEISTVVESRDPVIVGITHGDINGVGYETILKSLNNKEITDLIIPVIYGSARVAVYFQRRLALEDFTFNSVSNAAQINKKRVNIVNITNQEIKIESGKPSKQMGELAVIALEHAVGDIKKGLLDVIVTAPINKDNTQNEHFNFVGHTEFFADSFGVKHEDCLMFMVHDKLRIGLVTNHLPLNKIAATLNKNLITHKIKIMAQSLRRDFGIVKPKIAVLSLNPHAGDNGFLGNEEKTMIEPAIAECYEQGIMVYGPYASDGFFGTGKQYYFDGVLAMYHDQGMTPFKALSENGGVNFTAGLPIVRTSPAHGTAYDIAGKGEASPTSMTEAMFLACDIYRNRKAHDLMYENPLKIGIAQEIIGIAKDDETIDPFAEGDM